MTGKIEGTVTITLGGEAGKGLKSVESILTRSLKLSGYHIFSTKELMSRIRGGSNSTQIRVSDEPVDCLSGRTDFLLPLDAVAAKRLARLLDENSIVIADESISSEIEETAGELIAVPVKDISEKLGASYFSTVVLAGIICGIFGVDIENLNVSIRNIFSGKDEEVVKKNLEAAKAGFDIGRKIVAEQGISIGLDSDPGASNNILLNGAEAVGLGAIAGGCDFICSYPMSPSTGVLTFLSANAGDFGILVEQAEDEISAINMALGAWYAGGRAMVTTSGGGFALMEEGVSLSGITEIPVVVHVAQRPGPGTGLPTRTEQADLEMVLYSGHGEFPRMIFAPGDIRQAFGLTRHAFDMAGKYQIPVFILTDQYTMDSYYDIEGLEVGDEPPGHHFVKTEKGYRRYELTKSGISPRGIPSYGEGLVMVDSDEHDEEGRITEDLDLRDRMVGKRLGKAEAMREDLLMPKRYSFAKEGDTGGVTVICWGSTLNPVKKAAGILAEKGHDLSVVHFSQVHPLPEDALKLLSKAKSLIAVEGNATGQFSRILRGHYGIEVERTVLKYSGMQFSEEELADKLLANVKGVV